MKVIINENNLKKILNKVWERNPYFDEIQMKMFGISEGNPFVKVAFQEHIGLKEMTKRAEKLAKDFKDREFNTDNCGTYDLYFKVVHMFIKDWHGGVKCLYIECDVDYDESTARIPFYDPNAPRRPLSEIIENEEDAWEVREEIKECIQDYFDYEYEFIKYLGSGVIIRINKE